MPAPARTRVEGLDLGPEFLPTKIAPPNVAGRSITRQRLLARIGVPPLKRLTLVHAPAGFGKSSLLAAWSRDLALAGMRPAWLSLEPQDADVHHFLGYVAAALNAVEGAIGSDVIELLGRRGRAVSPSLLVYLLVESVGAHPGEVVFVIDDYHEAAGSAIDKALSEFVLHLPANLHLVIAGRSVPPLRLDRLRAAGQVIELGPDDLAFDGEETRAFFLQASGHELAPQELARLREFSEGWPACLQLAAISMRRKQDLARVLDSPRSPGREISIQLRDDVLRGIEPELKSFMMRTAVFERFSPGLAGAVTGVENARALIEAIERRQLFLIPLDERGEWFRYHPLFGNCLREELAREAPGEEAGLHARACEWFTGEELWGEAVRHAMAAGEPAMALAIVEGCAMEFVRRGDFLTLTSLLRKFPDQAWRGSIPLLVAYAWALAYCGAGSSGEEDPAAILADIEARARSLGPAESREVATSVLLIRLTIDIFLDDSEHCDELLEHVDPALGDHDTWASDIVNTVTAYIRLNSGDSRGAREYLPCLYPFKRVYQQAVIAMSWMREGRMAEAARELARAQELALGEFGSRSICNLVCQGMFAPFQYERGQFDLVEQELGGRLGIIDEVAPTDVLLAAYSGVAWSRAALGAFGEAEALLRHVRELAVPRGWKRAEAWALVETVRLRVAQGSREFGDLEPRLEEIGAATPPERLSTQWEAIQCARLGARFCGAMRQIDPQALSDLAGVVAVFNAKGAAHRALKANLLLARACLEHGATSRARELMHGVHERARELGMQRTVQDSGAWVLELSAESAFAPPGPGAAASTARPDGSERAPASATSGTAEELSQREREVLNLVERGCSNKEIGKALTIAPETVKWHIKNLFAKLGVANRMQAVNRARNIDPPPG